VSRYDTITVRWFEDFGGYHDCVVTLGPEDQTDPRLRAIVDWWRDQQRKQMQASRGDGEAFPLG
jgi:hypothetical protein